jgi:hypothetical protein
VRHPRIAVLAAVLTACVLAVPAPAMAQAKPEQAMVRVAHFSPDASYVDVYMVSLNRRQLFPNVFYKSVSAYWQVAAGPFTYEVRAAGAGPESQPVIQVKGNLAAGKAYTVAAVGRRDQLQGLLLRDDMAPSAPGKAKVRFLDAAFDLPAVDIAVAGGPVLKSRLAYPEPTGYRQLASGRYRVEVRRADAGAVLVKGTVAVKPGTVTSVALLGGAGERRELYAFSDAAGSRSAPAGGIRTGAGGTAPSSPGPNAPTEASPAEVEAVQPPASAPRWSSAPTEASPAEVGAVQPPASAPRWSNSAPVLFVLPAAALVALVVAGASRRRVQG